MSQEEEQTQVRMRDLANSEKPYGPARLLRRRGTGQLPQTPFKPPSSIVLSDDTTQSMDESQELSGSMDISGDEYEEHIREEVRSWLNDHGRSLFSLETSKFLKKLNKPK